MVTVLVETPHRVVCLTQYQIHTGSLDYTTLLRTICPYIPSQLLRKWTMRRAILTRSGPDHFEAECSYCRTMLRAIRPVSERMRCAQAAIFPCLDASEKVVPFTRHLRRSRAGKAGHARQSDSGPAAEFMAWVHECTACGEKNEVVVPFPSADLAMLHFRNTPPLHVELGSGR